MPDYAKLIDAETWAFIERTNSYYPPDTSHFTMTQHREVYDAMCRGFHYPYPSGVTSFDSEVPTPTHKVPVRVYRSGLPASTALVLYFHGGAFTLGGLESHDSICADLAAGTGYEVIAVDYRLVPEHLHPAQFEDAMNAFEWATETSDRPVVLCGDSAGGNLAAAISHATRRYPRRPAGQVLIYPGLGGDIGKGSYVEHANAPLLGLQDILNFRGIRSAGAIEDGDVTQWPLADDDFAELPPTVIITAQCDPLSSDGEVYRDRILAAGGKAYWKEEAGLVHGYLRARRTVDRARDSFERIVEAVAELGRGEWPY